MHQVLCLFLFPFLYFYHPSHGTADLFHLTSSGDLSSLYHSAVSFLPSVFSTSSPSIHLPPPFTTPPRCSSHLLCVSSVLPFSSLSCLLSDQCSCLLHFPQNSFPFVLWKLSPTWGRPAEDLSPCAPAGPLKVT